MKNKKFRMFSGPNGSGKSTLIDYISNNYNIGSIVNADQIEYQINKSGYINGDVFSKYIFEQQKWNNFIKNYTIDKRFENIDLKNINFKDNYIISKNKINSYQAAFIAEFIRDFLLINKETFSFETVMSHESKIEFLKKAKHNNFKTYLYFIATQDPKINIQRVKNRVKSGFHDVPENKIITRYYKSLELLHQAFLIVDRAFVIDNSNNLNNLILEKKGNKVDILSENIPEWINMYLIERIL